MRRKRGRDRSQMRRSPKRTTAKGKPSHRSLTEGIITVDRSESLGPVGPPSPPPPTEIPGPPLILGLSRSFHVTFGGNQKLSDQNQRLNSKNDNDDNDDDDQSIDNDYTQLNYINHDSSTTTTTASSTPSDECQCNWSAAIIIIINQGRNPLYRHEQTH